MGWARARATTTPGQLILVSILVLAVGVACGIVATTSERSLSRSAQGARGQTEPLLLEAVTLYTALSDANATATTTFLTGGLEPLARRARYLADLRTASGALVGLTREVETPISARQAVSTITAQLPVYAGLIETARANNRQGLPVGAAYLRQASSLLTGTVLPAAERLYTTAAKRLSAVYASGTATSTIVTFGVAAAVALLMLMFIQVWLARLSHRLINPALLLATIVLTACSAWAAVGMVSAQNALAKAQRKGSDSVEALSATRVLFSRAQTDESLTLVDRGSDVTDPADFGAVVAVLSPSNGRRGLLGEVAELDRRAGTAAASRQLDAYFASYRAQAARIAMLEATGNTPAAIALAVSSAASSNSPGDRVSTNLDDQIRGAQARFVRAAADATSAVAGLSVAIPLVSAVVVALALIGLQQRLREYR